MSYYFSKSLESENINNVIELLDIELRKEGFGILTDIDMRKTFEKKLGIDFKEYRILGACHPEYAHKALKAEDKIGTLLPCSIIVQQISEGNYEIAAVDPMASMSSVPNENLGEVAVAVQSKMKKVIANL